MPRQRISSLWGDKNGLYFRVASSITRQRPIPHTKRHHPPDRNIHEANKKTNNTTETKGRKEETGRGADTMPSLASPLPPPSKKRRLSDADAPHDPYAIPSPPLRWEKPDRCEGWPTDVFPLQRRGAPRRVAPLPSTKRARVGLGDEERRRARSPVAGIRDGAGKGRACLAPCHICHRRPTKKSDLDSFADCEGCGERACFICIRECIGLTRTDQEMGRRVEGDMGADISEQEALSRSFRMDDADDTTEERGGGEEERRKGWAGGHRGVVCSRCCVEMGPDGEISCLGCLSRMEGV